MDRRIDCHVTLSPDMAVGVFANAFRIIHDSGCGWFLDFLAFSETDQTAMVVSRVRVEEPFLESIKRRFEATLVYIHDERSKGQIPMAVESDLIN